MAGILDDYMERDELLAELKICGKTLDRWHALGKAPPKTTLPGRRTVYRRSSVEAWLLDNEEVRA